MSSPRGRWQKTKRIDEESDPAQRVEGGSIAERPSGILLVTIQDKLGPIAAGATKHHIFSGPVAWRGKSFSVQGDAADYFEILGMQCGMLEYVTISGPIPCSLFSDRVCASCREKRVAEELGMEWPTVYPGSVLGLIVRNVSDLPRVFSASFEAERLPGGPW